MRTAGFDSLDRSILQELEVDGRLPISAIAKKLGVSRHLAGRRMRALLSRKAATPLAFTNPRALGYRTLAITGVQVLPGFLHSVSDRLSALPSVLLVITTTGRNDIMVWAMFEDETGLSIFLARDIGGIPGIISHDTMLVLDWWVSLSPLSTRRWRKMSFFPNLKAAGPPEAEGALGQDTPDEKIESKLDQVDLSLLRELEHDPTGSVSKIAKSLGISRPNAGARLDRLLKNDITRVVAFVTPFHIGYPSAAIIGIKARPNSVDSVMESVRNLPSVYWAASVAGRFDVIALTVWPDVITFSRFLGDQLGLIPGIASIETTMVMDARKMAFAGVASAALETGQQR